MYPILTVADVGTSACPFLDGKERINKREYARSVIIKHGENVPEKIHARTAGEALSACAPNMHSTNSRKIDCIAKIGKFFFRKKE